MRWSSLLQFLYLQAVFLKRRKSHSPVTAQHRRLMTLIPGTALLLSRLDNRRLSSYGLIPRPEDISICLLCTGYMVLDLAFRSISSNYFYFSGLILVLPCTDMFVKVDLRTVTCNIPPQEILTKDAVTTQVDGVVYYRIHSAVSAIANITDVHSATFLLAQTTLRNVLGTQSLAQLLAGREEIAHSIQAILDSATEQWGIKVARVEIKDVRIPVAMQRAMAAKAEAAREAKAKVVAADGEMNASKALKQASMVLAESPAGLQLRYLQTLTTLAAENNSTIVFPLPINILESLGQKNKGG
uniref:Stomatin like 3 n=1 Tax=Strix occidentalis caurina TaxID=311401 RepID=A0A8D0FCA7_STROC